MTMTLRERRENILKAFTSSLDKCITDTHVVAIAISYKNQRTCSCNIPESVPDDAKAVLKAMCDEKERSQVLAFRAIRAEDWNEILVIKDGQVRCYLEEDWTESKDSDRFHGSIDMPCGGSNADS